MAIDNKDKKVLNVPHLRFPEFSGEWENTELQYIAPNICSGKDKPTSNGTVALYGSTGIIGMTRLASYNEEIVLVARVGANAGQLQITTIPCGVTDNTLIINAKEWNRYIYYYLQHYNLNRLVFGSGQPLITGSMLKKLKIIYGEESERNKIVNLLCLLDERIATQNKIIEDLKKLKCAIIDYTFDNKTQSHRKRILLSDVSAKITRRNTDNQNFNVLSNSANQGIIPQNEVFDREIANENNTSNYFVISQNDFVYNPRKSVTAPYGPINRYNGETNGVISPLYLCFRCYGIDVEYLGWYFKSDSWHKYVYQNGDTGVRHDRVSIKDEIFFSMPLYLHSTEEQMEIAKRLNKIESFVSQEEKYLFLLRSQKLYLLQQMFI
ncbi:restriction endonuclease subunit S [Parabacteroides distasonis]|uniref:restriction endonuclease subunit S n=2 Tax=Parabacteroides distasonis TaxID=823 RepID=UPI001425012B|nr:restriction endonuclease subunit S [Parabacteroides distasonis]MRY69954.1 restriction endonuclease subunit S [Parabacteroides distasonis]